jgi:hypothetical protein
MEAAAPNFLDVDVRAPRSHLPVFAQSGDLAASLPAPIRKKFKALREKAERDRRQTREISQRRQALLTSIPELKEEITAMIEPRNGRGLEEDGPQVRGARLQLASMKEDLENLNVAYSDPAVGMSGLLVSKLEVFIRQRGSLVFELVRSEASTLKKGESLPAAIESRRRRIRELDADLKAAESAPWPSRITKQKAREQLAELGKRGRPDVFALVERGQPIVWPMLPTIPGREGERADVDAAALIAWALGPVLTAAIDREIDELSDDQKALTAEQRRERKDQILADKLVTEREEESLIERAEAEGLPVTRRTDADPRAVLCIR